jgi:zinc transporter
MREPLPITIPFERSYGLICAFQLGPVAPLEEGDTEQRAGKLSWLHFNLSDARARAWLESKSNMPAPLLSLFMDGDARPRVIVTADAVLAVLDDFHHDFRDDPEAFGAIRIYLTETRFISARPRALKTIDVVRRELASGEEDPDSPLSLFVLFIERLSTMFAETVTALMDSVDDAEDALLTGQITQQAATLGRIRRLLLRLRRHLGSNRSAVRILRTQLPKFCTPQHRERLLESIDHLDHSAQDLDLVQDRTRLLQEEIAGKQAEATNRNLYLISVATTILLPVTLVTGIWGMNVGGLPWADDPAGFHRIALLIAGVAVGALLLLHRSRVL